MPFFYSIGYKMVLFVTEINFVTKIVLTCSSDREFLLKFEAVGHEFSKILRLLEQFIQTEQF